MKKLNLIMVSSILLFISACVTINVYFPAAEAEDAAAKIVNKIIGEEGEVPESNNPQSSLPSSDCFASDDRTSLNSACTGPLKL